MEVLRYMRFKRGNTVKLRNGIMFDFYPGLPHILWFIEIYWTYMHSILEYLDLLLIGLAESPDTDGRDGWVTSPSGYVPVLLLLTFHLQRRQLVD